MSFAFGIKSGWLKIQASQSGLTFAVCKNMNHLFSARISGKKSIGKKVPLVSKLVAAHTKVICFGIWKTIFVNPSSIFILISPLITSHRKGKTIEIASKSFGVNKSFPKSSVFPNLFSKKFSWCPPKCISKRINWLLSFNPLAADRYASSDWTSAFSLEYVTFSISTARPRNKITALSSFFKLCFANSGGIHFESIPGGNFASCSKSSSGFSGLTKSMAVASNAYMRWFRQAFLAASISMLSFNTSAAAITTSSPIPTINNRHPHFAFHSCRLKSFRFENCSFSIPCSIQSAKKTIMPPAAAKSGQSTEGIDSSNADIVSEWSLAIIILISAWFFVMFLATPLENLFFKWWDKKHPTIIH